MTERLTGIAGSMFSGKTGEVIRLVNRAEEAGKSVLVFKPDIDTRWGRFEIRSHSGANHPAIPVKDAMQILTLLGLETEIVAIDEVQFFGKEVVDVVTELIDRDIEVIVAGLPLDFRGEEFGQMPRLLARADKIIKLTAICKYSADGKVCGEEATRTQRIIDGEPADYGDEIVLIGAGDRYEPRCPTHHIVPGKPQKRLPSHE